MVGVASCIIGVQGCIFYLLSGWGVWHGMLLEIVCNNHSLLRSMEGTYYGQVCIVVLGVHLVREGSGPCKIPNLSQLIWSYGDIYAFCGTCAH